MNDSSQKLTPFFISIIPNFADQEEYLAELIRERYTKTGIEYYAMSYPLHPQGNDLYEKVKVQKASFRKLKELLKDDEEISLGILFQSTVGHGGVWNLTPQCSIEADHILKADGSFDPCRCPLDERFLEYIRNCVTLLCEERPAFVLTDDDMRMADGTCYCDRHVKLISEMTGRDFSRETLAAAVEAAPPAAPVAIAFEKAQIDAMERLCFTIRDAIDAIDPAIRCGCCISVVRYDYAERETRALAGKTEPFLRICNGSYLEGPLREAIWKDALTGFQVALFKDKKIPLLDESDTCPHNRFSKSARTMHAHISAGLLRGLSGGKLWLDQTIHPLRDISRPYEDILAKHRNFYGKLMELARTWRPEGCAVVVPALEREPFPAKGMKFYETCSWVTGCLERCGIPSRWETEVTPGIQLLNGGQIDYFTDEELRHFFSGNLLIDGPAAVKLTQRGFSALMGVRAEEKNFCANREVMTGSGLTVIFHKTATTPFLTMLPGTEELSRVYFAPYTGCKAEKIMPGSTFFANSCGGKVIVSAMNPKEWHPKDVSNPGRKLIYLSYLEKLGGLPCCLPEMQDSRVICGSLPDGGVVCAVFNTSYDPLPVRITAARKVEQFLCLTPEGIWEELPFNMNGRTVETDRHLEPGEFIVCKMI